MRRLYEPCACCGGIIPTHAINANHGFEDLVRQLADEVYKSRKENHYSSELVEKTASELMDAIGEGYGDLSVDWETPDKLMLDKLVENVFQFSGAKSYQQLLDFTEALKDDKGDLRDFQDYKDAIDKLGYKYNEEWLLTEYQTAVSSAQNAARWVEFQEDKEIFPLLEYQTIGDDRVRQSHQLLDGVIRPVEDVFWSVYYPPNGYNCRCEVLQVPDSDAKQTNLPAMMPTLDPMFKTNLAESGLIFPKGHPYYNGVPADILKRSLQYIPTDFAFRDRKGYEEHAMVQHEPERWINRAISMILSRNGITDIKLMPRLHQKETLLRNKILGKEYIEQFHTKNADALINGVATEFKESGIKNLSRRIKEAAKQANVVVLRSKDALTQEYMERFVKGRWNLEDRANITRIYLINDGKVHTFDRPI